jgi:peptidoglycan/xylan/chitin deacetylase (PgdA/CDA1 family)
VTFDDGYQDVLGLAAPILGRLGIPATVFLNTDFVGTDRRFWWEQLGALLRSTSAVALDVAETAPELRERWELPAQLPLGDFERRERAHWLLSMALMRTVPSEVGGVLERLSRALRAPLQLEGRDFSLLDWDEARELRRRGVDLGAHGASHANLGLLANKELEREVGRSVEGISARIDAPVETFAYPYGGPEHRSPEAAAAISRSGCRAAFTTDAGTIATESDRWNLPRRGLGRPEAFLCAQRIDAVL